MGSSGPSVGSGPPSRVKVDYPWSWKMLPLGGLAFLIAEKIWALLFPEEAGPITIFSIVMTLFFTALCVLMALQTFLTYFIIDDEGIHAHLFYRRPFLLRWDEVQHIHSLMDTTFKVVGGGTKLSLDPRDMNNVPEFAYLVRTHLPESRYRAASARIQEMAKSVAGRPVPAYRASGVGRWAIMKAEAEVRMHRKKMSRLVTLTAVIVSIMTLIVASLQAPLELAAIYVVAAGVVLLAVLIYAQKTTIDTN